MRRVALALLASVAACAPAPRPPVIWYAPRPSAPAPIVSAAVPMFASVTLLGVVAGPGKVNGDAWDLGGRDVTKDDMQQIALAMGAAQPWAAVLGVLGSLALGGRPEIGGYGSLVTSAGEQERVWLPASQDSFSSQWSVRWARVPLDGSARIRVQLWDQDWSEHDPMGTFEIGANEIRLAVAEQREHVVRIEDPTGQLLLARISAFYLPD